MDEPPSEPAPRTNRRRRIAFAFLAALLVGAGIYLTTLADLRTEAVGDSVSPESESRARAMLAEMAQAHGVAAFETKRTMEVEFTDTWPNPIMGAIYRVRPENGRMRIRALTGQGTVRAEILDGELRGHVLGIQGWRTWTQAPEQAPAFAQDPALVFNLPTYAYFYQLPFAIQSATVVADAGPAEWNGRMHDRVFATWGGAAPRADVDQYLLWIDQQTRRLTRCDYTIREMGAFATGADLVSDYRNVDGVLVGFRHRLIATMPLGMQMTAHAMRVHDAGFDGTEDSLLRADAALPLDAPKP